MVLRFEVNQAEAFRQGVNVPKSTNHLDVDPAKLSQQDRDLNADRLDGIDVFKMMLNENGEAIQGVNRIIAKLPTFEALMAAIRENQAEIERDLSLQKNQALVNAVKKAKRVKPYVNAAEILAEKARISSS